MELEPITPERAIELYLSQRETEVTQATLYSHKSRLGHFVRWCNEQGIENLNTITGRKLYEYRIWRRNDGNLSKVTEKTQMDTLRVFIRWLESIEAVQEDLHIKVQSPSLGTKDNVREATLTAEQAMALFQLMGRMFSRFRIIRRLIPPRIPFMEIFRNGVFLIPLVEA